MEYLIPSFFAGVLTILAPCTLSLLPVILGSSVGEKNRWKPLITAGSLGISIILFTLLLKGTSILLGVSESFWKIFSGGLIIIFGIFMLLPTLWDRLSIKLGLYKSETLLDKSQKKGGVLGATLLGASLGPVFTTCSPTYALIIAIVLPNNFAIGSLNVLIYAIGLIIPLITIGYGGQKVSSKFRFAANPKGWFKRSLGIILLLTGIFVSTGFDKTIEQKILESGYLGPIQLEQTFLNRVN